MNLEVCLVYARPEVVVPSSIVFCIRCCQIYRYLALALGTLNFGRPKDAQKAHLAYPMCFCNVSFVSRAMWVVKKAWRQNLRLFVQFSFWEWWNVTNFWRWKRGDLFAKSVTDTALYNFSVKLLTLLKCSKPCGLQYIDHCSGTEWPCCIQYPIPIKFIDIEHWQTNKYNGCAVWCRHYTETTTKFTHKQGATARYFAVRPKFTKFSTVFVIDSRKRRR